MFAGRNVQAQTPEPTRLRVHGDSGKTLLQGADGLSWGNSFKYLSDAIDDAEFRHTNDPQQPIEIWVAGDSDGIIYKPAQTSATPSGTARSATYSMVTNCGIYGGFAGTEPGTPAGFAARNPSLNLTVLSGDYSNNDINDDTNGDGIQDYINYDENAHHVVSAVDVEQATLDGVRVVHGYAGGDDEAFPVGGGILVTGLSTGIIIRGCAVEQSFADKVGGGIGAIHEGALEIRNSIVFGNRAYNDGGGIYRTGGPTAILNSWIIVNHAQAGAGVYYLSGGRDFTMVSSIVGGNNAIAIGQTGDGGGMFLSGGATTTPLQIINSQIDRNLATHSGGGIVLGHTAVLSNVTIVDNEAGTVAGEGGGIWVPGSIGQPNNIINNSILWGNVLGGVPNQIDDDFDKVTVCYSDIQGGWMPCVVDGMNTNLAQNPVIVFSGGVFRIDCEFSPCVNAGSDAAVPPDAFDVDEDGVTASPNPAEPTPDLDLMTRIRRGTETDPTHVDMGAVEATTYHEDCIADTNRDGFVNVTDLLAVIGAWGSCPANQAPCPADVAPGPVGACLDRVVNVTDLLKVIGSWGACAVTPTGQGIGDDELPASYHQLCLFLCDGLPQPETCVHECFQAACETNGVPQEVCDCFEQYFNDEINENGLLRCLGVEIVDPT